MVVATKVLKRKTEQGNSANKMTPSDSEDEIFEEISSRLAVKMSKPKLIDRLKERRYSTDIGYLYVFVFLFSAWFVTVAVALSRAPVYTTLVFHSFRHHYHVYLGKTLPNLREGASKIFDTILNVMFENFNALYFVFPFISAFLFRRKMFRFLHSKIEDSNIYIIKIILFIVCLITFFTGLEYFLVNLVNRFYKNSPYLIQDFSKHIILPAKCCGWVIILILSQLKSWELTPNNELVETALRTLSTISFSIYVFLMPFSIVITLLFLMTIYATVNIIDDPLCYFIVLGGIYVHSFLLNFCKMVIAEVVVVYDWKNKQDNDEDTDEDDDAEEDEGEEEIDQLTVFACVAKVTRYHLSSVAYATMNFLSIFESIYKILKSRYRPEVENIFARFFYNIFLMIKMRDFAKIFVATHGYSLKRAQKESCELLIERNNFFEQTVFNQSEKAMLYVLCSAAFLFMLASPSFLVGSYYFREMSFKDCFMFTHLGADVVFGLITNFRYVFFMPANAVITSSVNTTFLCSEIEKRLNNATDRRR